MHKKRKDFALELGKNTREIQLEATIVNDFVEPVKRKKCHAIIDTGATVTVVPPQLAEELELEEMGEITTGGVHKTRKKYKKYGATIA